MSRNCDILQTSQWWIMSILTDNTLLLLPLSPPSEFRPHRYSVLIPRWIKHSAGRFGSPVECFGKHHRYRALKNVPHDAPAPGISRQKASQHSAYSLTGPREQVTPCDLRGELRHRLV